MTTLLLNTFLVLLILVFGAMAYYPLFAKSADTETPVESFSEDVVISIAPSPLGQRPTPITARRGTGTGSGPEHPGHIPAA